MAEKFLFLTEILGLKVYDLKGRRIGVVKDAAVVPLVDPVRVDRFLIGGVGPAWLTVRHDQTCSISLDGIHLRDENLTPYHSDEYMLRMVRDLLDQQIIDAHGRKVVRINDVTFERMVDDSTDALGTLEIDIGNRSISPAAAGRRSAPGAPVAGPYSAGTPSAGNFANIIEPDPQRRVAAEYFEPSAPATKKPSSAIRSVSKALLDDLSTNMIPYTPEELVALAKQELAWCEQEMMRASREMGLGNEWHKALELVKTKYVEPGKQPQLVHQLAEEAIAYVEKLRPGHQSRPRKRRLVGGDALARATAHQPVFLGGDLIISSIPPTP